MSALNQTEQLVDRIRGLSGPMDAMPTDEAVQLEVLPGVRAVLFDVYGTMLLSGAGDIGVSQEAFSRDALAEALRESGCGGDVETAAGLGRDWLMESIQSEHARKKDEGVEFPEVDIRSNWFAVLTRLFQENMIEKEPDATMAARVAVEYECRVNPVWPMPGLKDTLTALLARGVHLGMVSNAQFYTPMLFSALLDETPEQLGFDRRLTVYSYEAGEAKPSVWLFDRVLAALHDRYGILPTETLYVGNDMRNDLFPAETAGCWTALFAGDVRSLRKREDDPLCGHIHPDCVITSLDQILQCLEDDPSSL